MADKICCGGFYLGEGLELNNSTKTLNVISGGDSTQIGDIIATVREMSDDYVLCNGLPIDEEAYPELATMLPTNTIYDKWKSKEFEEIFYPEKCAYGNGLYVVVGWEDEDDNIGVMFSNSPSGEWTHIKIENSEQWDWNVVSGIKYLNGKWIIYGGGYFSEEASEEEQYKACFLYTDDLQSEWQPIILKEQIDPDDDKWQDNSILDFIYANGKFIAVGNLVEMDEGYSTGGVWYANELSGEWHRTNIGGFDHEASNISLVNEQFIICCRNTSDESSTIYYGLDLFDFETWGSIALEDVNVVGITYTNDKYLICGDSIELAEQGEEIATIWYTNLPLSSESEFQKVTIDVEAEGRSGTSFATYDKTNWIVVGALNQFTVPTIWVSNDLTNWTIVFENFDVEGVSNIHIVANNGIAMVIEGNGIIFNMSGKILPNNPFDVAKTYIKAK